MKISIITTTFNRKLLLLETIKSVQKSVLNPLLNVSFEHIIVDDGSTDGTEEFFKNKIFPFTKIYYSKKNQGQSYSRNKGIKLATGDWILPLDSDDILLQRTLFNYFSVIKLNLKKRWFISDFLRVDENLRYLFGEDHYGWKFLSCRDFLKEIFKGGHFIQGNVLFQKSLFKEVGSYDEKIFMGEDLDLYIRFLLKKAFPKNISFISHLHRIHGLNMSLNISKQNHETQLAKFYKKNLLDLNKLKISL